MRLTLRYTQRHHHLPILDLMVFRRFVLLILLALLPLRSFATSEMQISMAAGQWAALATHGASDAPHSAAMPCHGEAAQLISGNVDETTSTHETSNNHHSACTLCDLCHSVAMVCALELLPTPPASSTARLSLVSTDTGHALVNRLERPPRRS